MYLRFPPPLRSDHPPHIMALWFPRGLRKASNCRKTIFAAQLPSPEAILKQEEMPSLVGRGHSGGIFEDSLGEGNCESKTAARQLESQFCREASRCLAVPSGFIDIAGCSSTVSREFGGSAKDV